MSWDSTKRAHFQMTSSKIFAFMLYFIFSHSWCSHICSGRRPSDTVISSTESTEAACQSRPICQQRPLCVSNYRLPVRGSLGKRLLIISNSNSHCRLFRFISLVKRPPAIIPPVYVPTTYSSVRCRAFQRWFSSIWRSWNTGGDFSQALATLYVSFASRFKQWLDTSFLFLFCSSG